MSARQRKRLTNATIEHVEEDSDSDSEPEQRPKVSTFVHLSSSDESEQESSEAEESEGEENTDAPKKSEKAVEGPQGAGKKGAPATKDVHEDDDVLLDEAIQSIAIAANQASSAGNGNDGGADDVPYSAAFQCDTRNLSIAKELRQRFGGAATAGGGGVAIPRGGDPRRRKPGGAMMAGAMRKLLLGLPADDWPKPPSFIGGGLGMVKTAAPAYLPPWQAAAHGAGCTWFAFQASDVYKQLQARYELAQATMDPNVLVVFASQSPHHAEALLQLGMVLAHTGQMDRASDLVRRCLYVVECAYAEGFGAAVARGAARLDACLPENATYFAALFRHMQMAGMRGCPRTAAEVCRLLLSLDPLGDPNGALLFLDHFALASKQPDLILALHDSGLPIGLAPGALATVAAATGASAAAVAGESAATAESATAGAASGDAAAAVEAASPAAGGGVPAAPGVTVADLPGLNFSRAIALLDKNGKDRLAALSAMRDALLSFPAAVEPLLSKAGIDVRSTRNAHNWGGVLRHRLFASAVARLQVVPPPIPVAAGDGGNNAEDSGGGGGGSGGGTGGGADSSCTYVDLMAGATVLRHLVTAFVERNAELWKHERSLDLLYDGAALATQEADRQADSSSSGGGGSGSSGVGDDEAMALWLARGGTQQEAEVLRRAYGGGTPLSKYLSIPLSEFSDGYSQVPMDGLLDPQLLGPNLLQAGRRLRLPPGAGGGGGGGGGGRRLQRQLEEALATAQEHARRGGDGAVAAQLAGMAEGLHQGRLDPNQPMMQLFLSSLLPWNNIDTPLNPPPPPPPGGF